MKNTVLFVMVLIIFISFGCGSKKSSKGYKYSDELKNVDGYTQTPGLLPGTETRNMETLPQAVKGLASMITRLHISHCPLVLW